MSWTWKDGKEPPEKGGIDEILSSRRCPGVINKSSGSMDPGPFTRLARRDGTPADGAPEDAKFNRLERESFKRNRESALREKRARGLSRKKDTGIRHVGRMFHSEELAAKNKYGPDCLQGDNRVETLKRMGCLFEE